MSDTDDLIAAMNAPQPEQWCDRCQRVHAARSAGSFDKMIHRSAQALADEIDLRLIRQLADKIDRDFTS